MGKKSGQGAALGVLIAAGALCLVSAAAQAETTINVGTGSAAIAVSLSSGGASVAGTQNDITYTGATITGAQKCLRTNTMACTTDADCPLSDPTNASSAHEPCTEQPNCTVNAAGKEGFFSFLKTAGCKPPDCTCTPGTDCTAVRGIVVSLNIQPPTAIADGPLYTCTFNTVTSAVALPNSNQKASDPSGTAIAASGSDGSVTVGGTCDVTGLVTCSTSPCQCVDDCDNSGDVFGNEVTKAVNIVAGTADLSTCPQADANCDGNVFGNEVTIGVNNVANGCPAAP